MIEFKRAGDAMVFECAGFTIEVCSDSERIAVNPDRPMAGSNETMDMLTDAFKILDMMIEHNIRQTRDLKVTEMNVKVNVDTKDAEEAIRKLNEYVWKHAPSENPPGHRFREFMKREGL